MGKIIMAIGITSAGLNITLALRNALQQALLDTQNHQVNSMDSG